MIIAKIIIIRKFIIIIRRYIIQQSDRWHSRYDDGDKVC